MKKYFFPFFIEEFVNSSICVRHKTSTHIIVTYHITIYRYIQQYFTQIIVEPILAEKRVGMN